MIKSIVASTREIDDPQAAAAEILASIVPEKNLLQHSLGLISCFTEFEETGALKAVCDALPFDCIGATTSLSAANNEIDQLILTITVLTSDDCDFKTVSIPIADEYEEGIDAALSGLLGQCEEKPSLFLTFFPLINTISGDRMLTAVDKTTGGIPLFGTTAVDHTMYYTSAKTIYNGEMFRESLVMGAVYGNPEYTFAIASLDKSKNRRQKAIITESDGNILIGVNGKTALEYLEEIGLTKEELSTGLGILPLFVDHKDGTEPVARAVFALTPEGHAVCGGAMPLNATLSIGRIDKADVLHTTETTLAALVEKDSVVLTYSCLARYLTLGADNTAEAEKVRDVTNGMPYMFSCSAGEICPLPDAEGKLKNIFHNYTIAFCRLH